MFFPRFIAVSVCLWVRGSIHHCKRAVVPTQLYLACYFWHHIVVHISGYKMISHMPPQRVLHEFAPVASTSASSSSSSPMTAATATTTVTPTTKVVVAYGNGSGFHALGYSAPSPTTGLRKRFHAKAFM